MAYLRHKICFHFIDSVCAKTNPFIHAPKSVKNCFHLTSVKNSRRRCEQMFTFLNMYSRIKILEITTDMNKGFL